jgi:hypothetical protein
MRTWKATVEGSHHTIQIAHDAIFDGDLEIYVDGNQIFENVIPIGQDINHEFEIDGKPCLVRIQYAGSNLGGGMVHMGCTYEVLVDGKKQEYAGAEPLVSSD